MRSFLRSVVVAGTAALAVVATPDPARAQSARASRPTVAVLDLDFGSVQQWWSGNWDIGKGVADLLVDELVNDGSFRVIERKRLDAILAEQNFSNSERADPDAASVAKIGAVKPFEVRNGPVVVALKVGWWDAFESKRIAPSPAEWKAITHKAGKQLEIDELMERLWAEGSAAPR